LAAFLLVVGRGPSISVTVCPFGALSPSQRMPTRLITLAHARYLHAVQPLKAATPWFALACKELIRSKMLDRENQK